MERPRWWSAARTAAALALGAGLIACSSDGDPYVDSIKAELTTATFPCGESRCDQTRQYCVVEPSRASERRFGTSSREFSCAALPVACAVNPHCDCLAAPTCVERGGGLVVEMADEG